VHLIEILLPLSDDEGRRFDEQKIAQVREELTRWFGGITASRAHRRRALATPEENRCTTISSSSK
jgi:hypothetical protein